MSEIILVTGGNGLVGNAIQRVFPEFDHQQTYKYVFAPSSKICDLRSYHDVYALFNTWKPNYVIHLAANVGGLYKNLAHGVEMLEDNVLINTNVLKCANGFRVKKLITLLSTCIFPDKTTYPIDETMLHNGPPHTSNEEYAYAKRLLEVQCKAYNKEYNTNFMCVIPTNIYGPHDNFNLMDSHVIPALIHNAYNAKIEGFNTFGIKGTGNPLRQFVYSEDLARAILMLLLDYNGNDTIIVCPKEEISIKDTAQHIANYFSLNVITDPAFNDGQFKKTADGTKFNKLFPDFKFIPLADGIARTCEWFDQNYPIARK